MAEVIARHLLGSKAYIQSAGVDADGESAATKEAVAVMREQGLDISSHRSRPLDSLNLADFELVVAMTPSIAQGLRDLGVDESKIAELNISDPYGRGIEVYRSTAEAITHQLRRLLE